MGVLERTIRQVGAIVMQVLIEPAFDKLNALENKFFADLNQVINRLEGFAVATQDSLRALIETIRAHLMIINPFDPCVKKYKLFLDPNLSDIEIYWLHTCRELQQIETQFQDMDAHHVMGRYADLASTAKAFAGLHRATPEAEKFYLRDWAEFRRLSRLWDTALSEQN